MNLRALHLAAGVPARRGPACSMLGRNHGGIELDVPSKTPVRTALDQLVIDTRKNLRNPLARLPDHEEDEGELGPFFLSQGCEGDEGGLPGYD